jgi:TonB-linked SusC/RagA family outer membrane protein
MKLTVIFLTATFLNVTANVVSQQVSFSGKNASLEKVFAEVKKQTGYQFMYNKPVLVDTKPVTLNVENVPLVDFLNLILKDQPLQFSIDSKSIFISRKPPVAGSSDRQPLETSEFSPPSSIRLRVLGEDAKPLVGASVLFKNGKILGVTDAEGVLILNVSEGDVLVVSFVGYEAKEYKITAAVAGSSDRQLTISLSQKLSMLDETIVIAYGTSSRRFTTGNVAQVSSKEIERQPVQNPLLALQGRVPGLVVTQMTGMNGGAVQVRIQGQNSLRSGALEPLIVIDGVPYPSQFSNAYMEQVVQAGSPLNYINTSDIESISVLKDADATAIYGSRAANGAIIITTKKGKVGKPKLTFDLQQGWGKVTRHVDMMNTRQYLDMRYEAYKNDGINLATQSINSSNYDLKLWDTTRYTDWQKELIGRTAQYTNINAGVSGGTALVQYLVGASFNRQTTVFPGNFDDKAGGLHFSLNGSSPDKRLRIQLSSSYMYNQNRLPNTDLTNNAILLEPNAPSLYNYDGSLNWAPTVSGTSTWTNPLVNIFYKEFSSTTRNLLTNMNIGYTIFPGFVVSSNFGYNNLQSDLFQGTKLEATRPESRATAQRSATFGRRNIGSWIIEPQLQFEKNLGKGKLESLIGSTIQKSSGNYLVVQASGQPTNELLHSLAAATSLRAVIQGTSAEYTTRFNGLYGRVGYNWDKKYLLNLTGRRDGSSKFGEENRFHNFWSAGAGWIFSEEKWFQSTLPSLSFGKLRASYGTTGNDQISDYSYLSLYGIVTTDILYQGTTSFDVGGLANPFLQWEETRKLQVGFDLSAFKERIAIAVTYSRNRSSNQLSDYSLPDITGFTGYTKNFPATIQNTSWEFSLNTVNIKSKNINWNTNFNLTLPQNKVINFTDIERTGYASGNSGVIIGKPIGILKRYQYGGVDPATGNYYTLDRNGNPVYSPNFPDNILDRTARVSLLPKFYGGMSNSISYKNFQLDFLFQFVYKVGTKDLYFYSANGLVPGRFSGNSNQPARIVDNHWQKPGDNAVIGRFTNQNMTIWPYNSFSDEGFSYAAGSYVRLKNLSLSWQLPHAWSKRTRLQTTRIYFRGQNLATITGYTGLDPETRSINTLPPLQMWTVGVKIEL